MLRILLRVSFKDPTPPLSQRSSSLEVFFSTAFWFWEGFWYSRVACPRTVTLPRFGYRHSVFPFLKPWGLFSYPNALEIYPIEFYPPWRRIIFKIISSSHCVNCITGTKFLRPGMIKQLRIQSFVLQRVRTCPAGFYSNKTADTLLGFRPSRVCPAPVIEWISPFFLSLAWFTKSPKRSRIPTIQSFADWSDYPSPKRWHPLLGFLTSSVFWQSKTSLALGYLIPLEDLVAIASPIFFALNQT